MFHKYDLLSYTYSGLSFGDPYPHLSIYQIQGQMAQAYPELASPFCEAKIFIGEDGIVNIVFEKTAGTKSSTNQLSWSYTVYFWLITVLHVRKLRGGVQGKLAEWILPLFLPRRNNKVKGFVLASAKVGE